MPIEIERKFLVREELWNCLKKPEGKLYRQGYIANDLQKSIRVRIAGKDAWLAIKSTATGVVRIECEYPIPIEHAEQLLAEFSLGEVIKTRYKISYDGVMWEVDEFHGHNSGLIIAEIELDREDSHFNKPDWISAEVTDDSKYYNSNLILMSETSI